MYKISYSHNQIIKSEGIR